MEYSLASGSVMARPKTDATLLQNSTMAKVRGMIGNPVSEVACRIGEAAWHRWTDMTYHGFSLRVDGEGDIRFQDHEENVVYWIDMRVLRKWSDLKASGVCASEIYRRSGNGYRDEVKRVRDPDMSRKRYEV